MFKNSNVFLLAIFAFAYAVISSAQSINIVVPAISGYNENDRPAHFNWQFESSGGGNVQIGQFACGSYWVAPANGDTGVKVLSITGNPAWTDYVSCDADPITESHGLMGTKRLSPVSAAAGKDAGPVYGSYNASENIIPNLPMTFSPASGSCNSLVAAMQRNETDTSPAGTDKILGEAVDAYCVITILPSVPANNGADMIRPNVTGTYKEFLTWSDFDLTRIPTYSFMEGYDSEGWEKVRVRWTHSIEVFGIFTERSPGSWNKYSEGGRAFRSHIVVTEYGAGVAKNFNSDLLALFSSANTLAEKKTGLAAMLAYGLDIYHARYDYGSGKTKAWSSGAGQSIGTFVPPVLLASLLIDDEKANQLKMAAVTNHDEDRALRGPQELRQATRGVTGVLLWGDGTPYVRNNNTMHIDETAYWGRLVKSSCFDDAINGCVKNGGSKTEADPYGYIDGPPNIPGYGYISTSAGGVRSFAAAMILMPSIREVVNSDDPIEYVDRLTRHGLWTYPDPVAIPSIETQQQVCSVYGGASCPGFGVTWGADPADVRFAIEDGTGRFVSVHGDSVGFNYEPGRSADHWDEIIALYDGDTFEDNAVPLGTLVSPEIIFEFGSSPKAYIRTPNVLAEIRYTVNGSTPTTSSTLYTGPFSVSENDVVRAKAFQSGKTSSAVRVRAFGGSSSDLSAPSIPTGLSASNITALSADISWNASSDNVGVAGYKIYINGVDSGNVTGTSASLTGLTPDTSYSIGVSAYDAANNSSAVSSTINVSTLVSTDANSLLIDVGATLPSGSETNSPAHQDAAVSSGTTTWNVLSTATVGNSNGSLLYGDGSSASGVSAVLGSSLINEKIIRFETTSTWIRGITGNNSGIISGATPAKDCFLPGPSGGSNDYSIGIRIDGLAAGQYDLYLMGSNTYSHGQKLTAFATTGTTASTYDFSSASGEVITNAGSQTVWTEGITHAVISVSVATGESVYIAFDGDPAFDNRGFINAVEVVSLSDTQAPSVPTGLTSSNITTSGADISWNASSDNVGVEGYAVYIDNVESGTVTGTSVTLSGLSSGTSYDVSVSAYDGSGNESAQSSVLEVTTDSGSAPSVVGITASAEQTGNEAEDTRDEDLNTRWAASGDPQWIEYEFNQVVTLESVDIAFYNGSSRSYFFDLEVSTNGTTWTTVYSGQSSGSTLGLETFDSTDASALYVRYMGYGNTENSWNSLTEVEFMISTGDTTAPTTPSNLMETGATATTASLSWSASSDNVGVVLYNIYINGSNPVQVTSTSATITGLSPSSSYTFTVSAEDAAENESSVSGGEVVVTGGDGNDAIVGLTVNEEQTGNVGSNVLDGSLSTRWSAEGDGDWIEFELDGTYLLQWIEIAFYNGDVRSSYFDIEVSTNGTSWTTVYSGQSGGSSTGLETFDVTDTLASYVRYVGHGNSANDWNSLTEVELGF